ncbi:hypothetical protein ACLB6G_17290 [Zhengella sp. ZM62]|uniref:hypothetical protein n=1 Tax=Zhengella sedimenti TaxID=3390035 RepID=UPI003975E01B
MTRRGWFLSLMLLGLAACQTAGGGDATVTLESARREAVDASGTALPETAARQKPEAGPGLASNARQGQPAPAGRPRPGADPVLDAVEKIGRLQKAQGTLAAMDVVFACYEHAKDRKASLSDAKVCAAQDFAVSKSVEEGRARRMGGQSDVRATIIASRVAQRIGALMQLKGMGQAEFDRFGQYLHQVAKPAHARAMS